MSGTIDKRPELMILIAVLVALAIGIAGTVATCGMLVASAGSAVGRSGALPGYDLDDIEDLIGSIGSDADGAYYTEEDVPDAMDIDVPELRDDLETCINHDIESGLKLDGEDVKLTELTKDEVGTPELKNGQVLCEVKGTAAIENADGESGTVGYTSYYYAADPTAEKITWYIYGYDLGSYELMPDGFERVSGDPIGVRDYLQDDRAPAETDLSKDRGKDAKSA